MMGEVIQHAFSHTRTQKSLELSSVQGDVAKNAKEISFLRMTVASDLLHKGTRM